MNEENLATLRDYLANTWSENNKRIQAQVWERISDTFTVQRLHGTFRAEGYHLASRWLDQLWHLPGKKTDCLGQVILVSGNVDYDLPVRSDGRPTDRSDMLHVFDVLEHTTEDDSILQRAVYLWDHDLFYETFNLLMRTYDYFFADVLERYQYETTTEVIDGLADDQDTKMIPMIARSGMPVWDVSAGLSPLDRPSLIILIEETETRYQRVNQEIEDE